MNGFTVSFALGDIAVDFTHEVQLLETSSPRHFCKLITLHALMSGCLLQQILHATRLLLTVHTEHELFCLAVVALAYCLRDKFHLLSFDVC